MKFACQEMPALTTFAADIIFGIPRGNPGHYTNESTEAAFNLMFISSLA